MWFCRLGILVLAPIWRARCLRLRLLSGAAAAGDGNKVPSPNRWMVKPGSSDLDVAGVATTTSRAASYENRGAPTLKTMSGLAPRTTESCTTTRTARPISSGGRPATMNTDSPMA